MICDTFELAALLDEVPVSNEVSMPVSFRHVFVSLPLVTDAPALACAGHWRLLSISPTTFSDGNGREAGGCGIAVHMSPALCEMLYVARNGLSC